jgi:hypothetical protein
MPYSYLAQVTLDPGGGLVLRSADVTVTISGQALDVVMGEIVTQTAIAIAESLTGVDEHMDVFIDKIAISVE